MEVAPYFVDFHHFLSIFTIYAFVSIYILSRFTHFFRKFFLAKIACSATSHVFCMYDWTQHSFGRIQMSVISGIGCDLNPNTAFLSSLGMQEGSRGNTSLVIYIHPSSPHQLVKCPQCGLATKNARCSDIFAA